MNDLSTIMNYEQLKTELNEELSRTANSFVRIGYLLKLARDDRHILDGSGYSDVNEFAQKEYGLDKTQVSRFIRINDRFSIDGNSTKLLPQYEEYGSTKLSIMLTLPDEINEEISPDMSKSDIQAIKEEYDEENKITDLEVMMEEKPEGEPDEFIALVVKHLNDEHTEAAELMNESIQLAKKHEIKVEPEDIKENYMPDGDKIYNIRIEGQGRFMISMKEDGITITNMRDPANKSTLSWDEFSEAIIQDISSRKFGQMEEKKEAPKGKPKKVEKSKPKENKYVKEVREYHERENETTQPKEDIEKVEGEVVGMNPPEESGSENKELSYEKTELETRILDMLRSAVNEIEGMTPTNWGFIKDKCQDVIRTLNIEL